MNREEMKSGCERPDLHRALGRYEFGAVDDEERLEIHSHVLGCDACFAELERGAAAMALLQEAPARYGEFLREPEHPPAVPGMRAWESPRRLLLAVGAVFVAAFVVFVIGRDFDPAALATFPREEPAVEIFRGSAATDDVRELLATGAAHFDLGHYDDAARRFGAAFARDPGNAEAAYFAGLSRALAGDARGALAELQSASRLAQGDLAAKATWVLANASLAAGETAAARRLLDSLAREDGAFAAEARALLERLDGRAANRKGRFGLNRSLGSEAHAENPPARQYGADEIVAMLEEATRLYENENLQACRERVVRVVALAGERADAPTELRARLLLGDCLYDLAVLQPAGTEFEKAAAIAHRIGDRRAGLRAREGTARVQSSRGNTRQALAGFRQVLQEATQSGDNELRGRALLGIGQCQSALGERRQAAAALEESRRFARERELRTLEAQSLQELALVVSHSGDYETGIAMQEEALRLATRIGRKRETVGSLVRAGVIYAGAEQYSRALAALREAAPLAEALGHRRAILNIRAREAAIRSALGRPDEALLDYEAALALAREMQNARAEAAILRRMGGALAALERFEEAARKYDEAVPVTAKLGNPLDVADLQHALGEMRLDQRDFAAAKTALRRAVAGIDSLDHPRARVHWETVLAEVHWRLGERERAETLVDQVLAHCSEGKYRETRRDALFLRSTMAREAGDLETADRSLAEAIEVAETVRAGLVGSEHRVGFQERSVPLHAARVGVLFEIAARGGRADAHVEAFRVAEEARVRTLLDVLSGIRVDPGRDVGAQLDSREREALRQLRELQTELARSEAEGGRDAARIDSLDTACVDSSRRLRDIRQEIAARSPHYGQLLGFARPLDVSGVRTHVLLRDQILLEYLVGRDESFLFVVGESEFRAVRLGIGRANLEARVRAFRDSIQSGRESDVLGEELFGALLEPVLDSLSPGTRLVIVPDGPLFQLPFAALRHDGAYFVERHPIAHAPSASVLDERLRPRKSRRPSLLAVGNPATRLEAALLAGTRGGRAWRFGELPYAEEEVRSITRHFRRKQLLTGVEATEERVLAGLRHTTHLHFATHGLLDPEEPLLSGLALSQDEDPAEDGFLQVHEILDLELDADLVVLSACNTGLGRTLGGEGVLGLTRAFLHAGARQVLFSLWEVQDRSTVVWMQNFYDALFDDKQPADHALRSTQLACIAARTPPRDWAAFVLTGRMQGR